MSHVQVDLHKNGIAIDASFNLATPQGARRLIDRWAFVASVAANGNYEAVDLLVDMAVAIDDAFLSVDERDVVEYMRTHDFSVEEIAGIIKCSEWHVEACLDTACEKIARHLAGTEGYEGDVLS